MDTQETRTEPTVIGQTYCITAASPCRITADLNNETLTLLSLNGGQGTFVAPTRSITIHGQGHLTKVFKGAALTVQGGGDTIKRHTQPQLQAAHGIWYILPGDITSLEIIPGESDTDITEACLLLTPENELPAGWLSTPEGTQLTWLYGERALQPGFTYELCLTQRSRREITICLTAITTALPAAL